MTAWLTPDYVRSGLSGLRIQGPRLRELMAIEVTVAHIAEAQALAEGVIGSQFAPIASPLIPAFSILCVRVAAGVETPLSPGIKRRLKDGAGRIESARARGMVHVEGSSEMFPDPSARR